MDTIESIDPARAVSFSGHRPARLPGKGDPNTPEARTLADALRQEIEDTIRRGKTVYLHGAMAGWDILCAEQVIALKEQYPHIRLFTIAPYAVHFFTRERCWTPEWVERAKKVCRLSDYGMSFAENFRSGIYYERNRVLVNHSSELICYWDGGSGGTAYTVALAQKSGLVVRNLYS